MIDTRPPCVFRSLSRRVPDLEHKAPLLKLALRALVAAGTGRTTKSVTDTALQEMDGFLDHVSEMRTSREKQEARALDTLVARVERKLAQRAKKAKRTVVTSDEVRPSEVGLVHGSLQNLYQ